MERTVVQKSSSAMYLLFAEGFCFLLISVAIISCGFVLNFHNDFDYIQVESEHDYTQYWVGFVLFFTAFVAIAAGAWQRTRWLVLLAMSLFFVSILVSLFALVVEGNDWVDHKNNVRLIDFWESEDYECKSKSGKCSCEATGESPKPISDALDCETLEKLDYLYGGLTCCILAGVFLALSSIIIVMIFIPIRPFTVPVPKKKIKKITVLEEKPKPTLVAYRPPPKIPVEPKPRVEEILVRQRVRNPERVIVAPDREPPTEVEEIVLRERKPQQIRTVHEEARPQNPEVVYGIPRTRTLIYDRPRFEPVERQALAPVEPPPEQDPDDQEYDVGRFVHKVHPTPSELPAAGIENGFTVNPNFGRESALPPEPEPVYYSRKEMKPPVHYAREEAAPVKYVRREAPGPVHYAREEPAPIKYVRREAPGQVRYVQKPTVVYKKRPHVVHERALVPVRRSVERPRRIVVVPQRPRPSYVVRKPAPRQIVRRQRAYSDEGPGLERVRVVRPQKRLVYTTRPRAVRTYRAAPKRSQWQRVRSNSDEGARLYRDSPQRERPGVIYTDREIAMAQENAQGSYPAAAKPKVLTSENRGQAKPVSAHIPQQNNGVYDRRLEAQLPSADQWERRPHTPY
ncbi:titin-like [Dendronephthya gigantea]|uniref:titin-like n=1 Tax=Dendronephthya gigantea TaxID=151771 RepID=UPI00106CC2C7|nr:titin-like [Dendronephthya gigantea]